MIIYIKAFKMLILRPCILHSRQWCQVCQIIWECPGLRANHHAHVQGHHIFPLNMAFEKSTSKPESVEKKINIVFTECLQCQNTVYFCLEIFYDRSDLAAADLCVWEGHRMVLWKMWVSENFGLISKSRKHYFVIALKVSFLGDFTSQSWILKSRSRNVAKSWIYSSIPPVRGKADWLWGGGGWRMVQKRKFWDCRPQLFNGWIALPTG